QIFSTESDAIILFAAATGQVLDVNDAAVELYGYRRAELLAMTAPELSAEPHKSSAFIQEVRERRFGTVTCRWHRDRGGTVFPVEISMSAFELQGQEVVGAVVRSITERIAAEKALRESEQRFHDFADSASDWYWEMDENLRFTAFSERFTEITGVPQEELLGKTREETGIPGVEMEYWNAHLADLQAHRPFRNFVHPRRLPSGETVYLSVNGRPVHDARGDFRGYRGTGTDVTELKNAEEELRSYRYHLEELVAARTAALEASNRELQSFSYSVSHDLRSPLRAIDGFSYALLEDYAELFDERARDYLNRVRNASQRMGQLIDDLLELSRISRRKLRRDNVNLTDMATQINASLRGSNADRSVDVAVQPGLVCVGDSRMLHIALENLFDNAWKYTAQKPRAQIEFGCRERDGHRIYYVRDNGVGFDMRYVHKLFGEFQRLHADTKFTGTGIGLATVARVVNRHGGEVWAEGILGEGATFSFTLEESESGAAVILPAGSSALSAPNSKHAS
ncbi:MAG: PAS domain S-box protein, partial [Gammaproteobacteria bacterium]|nr:PAS domain S-box protein [Gammaproteobacteria bacterium]